MGTARAQRGNRRQHEECGGGDWRPAAEFESVSWKQSAREPASAPRGRAKRQSERHRKRAGKGGRGSGGDGAGGGSPPCGVQRVSLFRVPRQAGFRQDVGIAVPGCRVEVEVETNRARRESREGAVCVRHCAARQRAVHWCGGEIMAFCSTCGATVTGAFCSKCGASSGATQAQPPIASTGAPVARRTNPIVWVLVVILGLFILCGLGAAGIGYFVVHRVHQAGVSFDRTRDGGFAITGRDGKLEFGSAGKLPSWIPSYPGSKPAFAVRAQGLGGSNSSASEGGEFTFTTPDEASQVLAFYERKCRDMGMNANVSASNYQGGTVVAADEGGQRSLTIVATGTSGHTTVIVTYGRK